MLIGEMKDSGSHSFGRKTSVKPEIELRVTFLRPLKDLYVVIFVLEVNGRGRRKRKKKSSERSVSERVLRRVTGKEQ